MVRVLRRVREIRDQQDTPLPPVALSRFRDRAAWVLLGEPGAGKTTALQAEAEATGGEYLRIDQFVEDDIDPEWRGKTLFLDGLDEIRASGGGDSILVRVQRQLKRLGMPQFRIACRAADWYGSTDREDLAVVSPDRRIAVLLLEPLNREDILVILRENLGIPDAQAFVEEAENHGIADLLDNPQTLELLTKAVRGNQWPQSRDEVYRLACEQLAIETNKRYRNQARGRSHSPSEVLDAAGQLCAVLLLSDKTGIALDLDSADARFPTLNDLSPPDTETASRATGSRLFRPEGEERIVPGHRSIAEYLAARWLAHRIDAQGLPLQRLLNLLLGPDGGVVAGLRGLFGWLALHCGTARQRLIDADPLTVVIYGDVKPMPVADKKCILVELRRVAEQGIDFHWDVQTLHRFGALADTRLREDFRIILESPRRDRAGQWLADRVLDMLAHGQALPELVPVVLAIVRDDTRWPRVRVNALGVWLRLSDDPQTALALLEEIAEDRVTDQDDELAGMLLDHLYPKYLTPEVLLRHLHVPKNADLLGTYVWFWVHELPQRVRSEHLPILLDGLVERPEFGSRDPYEHRLSQMADALLVRGIGIHGDRVTDERLFVWLNIGIDEFGHIGRKQAEQRAIAEWLETRPERYKALLALCFARCEQHEHPRYCVHTQVARLHHAKPPEDIGLWHLEQAALNGNETLARIHLAEAVKALANGHGDSRLSLERLEAWAESYPERKDWLEELLYEKIPDWRRAAAVRENTGKQKLIEAKRERTIALSRHLSAIRASNAPPGVMHQLAGVWKNRDVDTRGETPAERFDNYCENGDEVLAAAEAGFRLCPERADLPAVDEIIDHKLRKREYLIGLPCLVGMELRWQDELEQIERLPESTLRRMIAFRLSHGTGDKPAWFTHLVRQHPALVAEVFIEFASAALKQGETFVYGFHPLEQNPEYRDVASIAAPRLLESFPVRARTGQLHHLESLLKAALRYTSVVLPPIIEKKLGRKGMDVAQKVYWYATAALLGLKEYESMLWRYVGKSEVRVNHLSRFLGGLRHEFDHAYPIPAKAKHQEHRLSRREHEFRFLSSRSVAQILANDAPTSAADLAALVLHHLDDIGQAIRRDNDDGFRAFWNIEKGKEPTLREENLCRDALLNRLRARLGPLGIDCQPEGDYFNDKRADIHILYRNEFELPIEIKRDSNPSLWTALREQLIGQYVIAPKAQGHGIYLVLWFGGVGLPRVKDGGKKPRSPEELQRRLENQLNPIEQQRIFVRVLDVSWPKQIGR